MLNLTMSNRLGLKYFLKMAQCDTNYLLPVFLSPHVLGEEDVIFRIIMIT